MKILLTFTAPAVYIKEALVELRKAHKDCSIHALASQKTIDRLGEIPGIDGVITFRGRFFNFFSFAFLGGLWKTRRNRFDEMVIFYNNPTGEGYSHLELIGFISGARKISALTTTLKKEKLAFWPWLKKRGLAVESYKVMDALLALALCVFWFLLASLQKAVSGKAKRVPLDAEKVEVGATGRSPVPDARAGSEKVLFICHFGYDLPSARVRCYNFADELKRLGIDAEVYSFYDKQGIDFRVPGDTRRVIANIRAFYKLCGEKKAVLYVQKGDYHFLTPLMLQWLNGNRIIFDIDDWEYDVHSFHFIKCGWIKKYMVQKSDMCIVASSFLKKEYAKYSRNIHFLPTVVDHKKFFPSNGGFGKNDRVVFSWVGMIWGPPILENVVFLMECFSELEGEEIQLEITGGGEFIPHVKRLALANSKDVPIKVVDWIHPSELPAYLNRVDAGLLPLITESKYNLSKSPTKLFEYMACGKPTISSRMGEAKEWIIQDGVNGLLAEGKEEFKEKILQLARDEEMRKRMGNAARRSIEEAFCQEKIAKELFTLVKSQLAI
ncbi:MAG: glycosyltransferase [Nitrospinae bacterium]|nr:glycosyltransferase [Nitrospinota bacterium]